MSLNTSLGAFESPDATGTDWSLYFGGPDKPPRRLRNLLCSMVDAQPAGAEIVWATYYFRDRDLAARLIAAADRGVAVRLVMEGRTRRAGANEDVAAILMGHGLGGGLTVRTGPANPIPPRGRLHSKIYCFSHPEPVVLIGSFNPSGDDPEDPAVIAEIGDQDRGHNLLLQLSSRKLFARLRGQVLGLAAEKTGWRFSRRQNAPVTDGPNTLYFYPRLRPHILPRKLAILTKDAEVSAAISHVKPGPLTRELAVRGAAVRLLVHDTERRAPEAVVRGLREAGVHIARYRDPAGLPMHAKFLLIEEGERATSWLGSYNHNFKSSWLNHEVLFRSADRRLFAALKTRLDEIAAAAQQTE
ncbi:MAG: phospholipase D-like domain-containing protein [Pseudomonadota bacterium]